MSLNCLQSGTGHLGSSFSSGEAATVTWESCSPPSTFVLSRPQSPQFNLLFLIFSYCTYLVFLFPIYGNPYLSLYLCQFTQWMSLWLVYFIWLFPPDYWADCPSNDLSDQLSLWTECVQTWTHLSPNCGFPLKHPFLPSISHHRVCYTLWCHHMLAACFHHLDPKLSMLAL